MVIDTSALMAILSNEPERHHFNEMIATSPSRRISAGTYLETAIVIEARYGRKGFHHLKLFLTTASIEVVAFDKDQAEIAADAFCRYGKGRHIAGLNYGDCFSYALAKQVDEQLLFKGEDFVHTDVGSATHL
jgi:ribonuclease VapC